MALFSALLCHACPQFLASAPRAVLIYRNYRDPLGSGHGRLELKTRGPLRRSGGRSSIDGTGRTGAP